MMVADFGKEKSRTLFEVADTQAGYFTAKQAEQAGYSRRMQHYYQKTGEWQRTLRGLYRLRNYPIAEDEQYAELTLWSRNLHDQPQAVLGFDTALQLHELSDLNPSDIHLIVPLGFRKKAPAGIKLHHALLSPHDLQDRGAYRVTTPLRTLLDLAHSKVSPEHLQAAFVDALRTGKIRASKLQQACDETELPVPVREYIEVAMRQA